MQPDPPVAPSAAPPEQGQQALASQSATQVSEAAASEAPHVQVKAEPTAPTAPPLGGDSLSSEATSAGALAASEASQPGAVAQEPAQAPVSGGSAPAAGVTRDVGTLSAPEARATPQPLGQASGMHPVDMSPATGRQTYHT